MKILLFYTKNQGYLSQFFSEFSDYLSTQENEIFIFSFKQNNGYSQNSNIHFYTKKKRGFISNYFQVFQIVKKIRPDVIIANFSYVNPAIISGYLFNTKTKIAWCDSLIKQSGANWLNNNIKRIVYRYANYLIANSYLMQQELIDIIRVRNDKIKVIPFYTNIHLKNKATKTKPNDIFKIGCPGRLEEHKNQLIVLKAIKLLNFNSNAKLRLFLAGTGNKKKQLIQYADENDLPVDFLDQLNSDKILDFYNEMDLIVLPSLHEAFGLVAIEAMALGRPVIISKNFGALSFIDQNKFKLDSFTFDPSNVKELAEILETYKQGDGHNGEYFQNLYKQTFNKGRIFESISNIILSETIE
ncbi:glycosyltransferase family 4 protein [Aegicerativicinus sediminis]|uniref:glycosyltransferase family 4 protein n=1 Tax=Aegicerativicinus sediminis TaxID=2893202 RepID=UPI001E640ADA|nr:glycosyltransferase family 4 protein [Aegicerativicinus sediminis]